MSDRGARAYRRVYLESASPARILVELLQRLIGDLEGASACIAAGDVGGKGKLLAHALEILGHLRAALDHAAAPELCANLARVYTFAEGRIFEGNVRVDSGLIGEALRALRPIHEGYAEAVLQLGGGTSSMGAGGPR